MSIGTRLKNIFRVQSPATQVAIIAIGLFIAQLFVYSVGTALLYTLVSVVVFGLIAYLIIKLFDRQGAYSMYTIWKTLLVLYLIYFIVFRVIL